MMPKSPETIDGQLSPLFTLMYLNQGKHNVTAKRFLSYNLPGGLFVGHLSTMLLLPFFIFLEIFVCHIRAEFGHTT